MVPTPVKTFKSYEDQVALLESRGMDVGDRDTAVAQLRKVNYYRISGYWYPFRIQEGPGRRDDFYPGTTLLAVTQLYEFDAQLRTAAFASLAAIELSARALLGHSLGAIDECAHLKPGLLNPRARSNGYTRWLAT